MNFIIEAEGAILCFILYLIPGFPKDIISYLFGISPMPFWLFAFVRRSADPRHLDQLLLRGARGRAPVRQGGHLHRAVTAAACLPLYYYRHADRAAVPAQAATGVAKALREDRLTRGARPGKPLTAPALAVQWPARHGHADAHWPLRILTYAESAHRL